MCRVTIIATLYTAQLCRVRAHCGFVRVILCVYSIKPTDVRLTTSKHKHNTVLDLKIAKA